MSSEHGCGVEIKPGALEVVTIEGPGGVNPELGMAANQKATDQVQQ